MNDTKVDIKHRVLEKIRGGDVSMRPRLHFSLQIAALVTVSFIALVLSVFVFNFILFSVRISGHNSLLGFGPSGLLLFIEFFPWTLLVVDIGCIALALWMLKRFRFGYRSPAILLFLAALVVVGGVSAGLDRGTNVNDRLFVHSLRHELPGPLADIYQRARREPPLGGGVCRCSIETIERNTLTARDLRDNSNIFTILLPQNDPRATTTGLAVGDVIFVAGRREGNTIYAFGLHKLPSNEEGLFPPSGIMTLPQE